MMSQCRFSNCNTTYSVGGLMAGEAVNLWGQGYTRMSVLPIQFYSEPKTPQMGVKAYLKNKIKTSVNQRLCADSVVPSLWYCWEVEPLRGGLVGGLRSWGV
jgi:hypothetical protein